MRKIILGIAIVFCVQVGFQLAMTARQSDGDYAALRTPLQNGIDTSPPSLDADDLDTTIVPVESYSQIESPARQTKVLIRYVAVPEYRRAPAGHPTTSPFKPVIITYDRTGALTGGSSAAIAERRSVSKDETQPDDRRSLVAKVVARPYDWLKAVGSKLR